LIQISPQKIRLEVWAQQESSLDFVAKKERKMSYTGIRAFDSTIQTTNVWLNDLADRLGWQDKQRAYHALTAVLHALRDRLPVDQAVALGAQLPMLVRGFYYEGWHPADKPIKERKKEEFLVHPTNAYFVSWRPRIFSFKNS